MSSKTGCCCGALADSGMHMLDCKYHPWNMEDVDDINDKDV